MYVTAGRGQWATYYVARHFGAAQCGGQFVAGPLAGACRTSFCGPQQAASGNKRFCYKPVNLAYKNNRYIPCIVPRQCGRVGQSALPQGSHLRQCRPALPPTECRLLAASGTALLAVTQCATPSSYFSYFFFFYFFCSSARVPVSRP